MERKTAFIKSLPVMAGYITLGIGFGLVYTSAGLSPLVAIMFSLFVYAGSMQYVSVSLIANSASPISMILMTLGVNLRHVFYSISMLGKYNNTGRYKGYLIFGLTDETFSIVCNEAPEGLDAPKYYFYLTIFNQSYWVLGTVLGVVLQEIVNIPFEGVDFSMTALFLVTFTDQILNHKSLGASALGIIIPALCLVFFGSSSFLIPSLLIISLVLCSVIILEEKNEK